MSYMISLVGGGGKTTTMYYLAEKYKEADKKVIVCTSTHIGFPNKENVFLISKAEELKGIRLFEKEKIAVLGNERIVQNDIEKLSGIDREEIDLLKEYADIILVEADGAKRLPLKVPDLKEPVIPQNTDEIIICAGIDALGAMGREKCFRFDIAKDLYSWDEEHIINEADIARIMTDKRAGLKNVSAIKKRFIINKADDEILFLKALRIKELIKDICKREMIENYEINIISYKNGFGLINI